MKKKKTQMNKNGHSSARNKLASVSQLAQSREEQRSDIYDCMKKLNFVKNILGVHFYNKIKL